MRIEIVKMIGAAGSGHPGGSLSEVELLAAPVQLPAVVNELQRATVDVRYHFTRRFAAGIVYWYDKYAVNDFAAGAQTLTTIAQQSYLMIGYLDRPYTANTFSGRVTYYW